MLVRPQVESDRVDHRFVKAFNAAKMIMAGAAGAPTSTIMAKMK